MLAGPTGTGEVSCQARKCPPSQRELILSRRPQVLFRGQEELSELPALIHNETPGQYTH